MHWRGVTGCERETRKMGEMGAVPTEATAAECLPTAGFHAVN